MFEDIGAEVNDLFANYNYSKELVVRTVNESGQVVTSTGTLTQNGPRLKIEGGMSENGDSTNNSSSLLTLKKFGIDSEGRVTGELSMKTSNQASLYINAEDERQEPGRPIKSYGTIGALYRTPTFTLDSNIDIVNGPTTRSSCFYHNKHWNIKFGSEIQLNTHFDDKYSYGTQQGVNGSGGSKDRGPGLELENFNLGMAFHGKTYIISARTNDRMGSISFGYHHQVSPKIAIGSIVNYGLTSNAQNLCMGAKIQLDNSNTFKIKVTSAADMSGMLEHKLNDWSTMTVCAKTNLHQSGTANQKFGFGIVFDASNLNAYP